MRKSIFFTIQDETEGQGIGGDTVFFDAADIWLPEEELTDESPKSKDTSPSSSPIPKRNGLPRSPVPNNQAISHRNTSPFQSTRPVNGHAARSSIAQSNHVNSHSNRPVGPSNQLSDHSNSPVGSSNQVSDHNNKPVGPSNAMTLRTLSSEEALPSVSVSVALQASQNTMKM